MLGTSAGWIAALVFNRALLEGESHGGSEQGARGSRSREARAVESRRGDVGEAEGNGQGASRDG
jgi:hypothetical protein